MRDMADNETPDLPTIKKLAVKWKVDFRTLDRFLQTGKEPRGALVIAACKSAAREWRAKVSRKAARS